MKTTQEKQNRMRRLRVGVLALAVVMALGGTQAWAAETKAPAATAAPLDEAKDVALQHAQFTEDAVTITKMAVDRDDGRLEYEIEFIAGGIEYTYEIDAETKEIVNASTEKAGQAWSNMEEGQYLTLDQAREQALAAAGVTAEQAAFTELQFDFEDRRVEYELEFTVDDKVYEVDLDAATGEVLRQTTGTRPAEGEAGTYRWDDDHDDD